MPPAQDPRPLIAHCVSAFRLGGMELILTTLLNRLPQERFRHAIICINGFDDSLRARLQRSDVELIALHKPTGKSLSYLSDLRNHLLRLRPAIFHSRNLGPLEGQWAALLAGVPCRVHGEHGRDTYDIDGTSFRYNLLRRATRPLIHRYIAVSRDLARWLVHTIGARPERVRQICNGVDTAHFQPRTPAWRPLTPPGFAAPDAFVIGTVGRLVPIKDQASLLEAFLLLRRQRPDWAARLRLLIVGGGPLRAALEAQLRAAGAASAAFFAGDQADVLPWLQAMDLFVLPSLGEGISNTILEAMACGLPILATGVGGNPELVLPGQTGTLVPPAQPLALAAAIEAYLAQPDSLLLHASASRARAVSLFSLDAMLASYASVYDSLLNPPPAPL